MLAYSAQDLILEPFAASSLPTRPGESTQLSGMQHGGVLAGMLVIGIGATLIGHRDAATMRQWTVGGCIASAATLVGLAAGAFVGPRLAAARHRVRAGRGQRRLRGGGDQRDDGPRQFGREKREGTAWAFGARRRPLPSGLGGFLGTAAVDLARALFDTPFMAYATVFTAEASCF